MEPLNPAPGTLETDAVDVRTLVEEDLDWVVRIDAQRTGRTRHEYYQLKLREAGTDTAVRISLAAAIHGEEAGFLMGRLYYGEFGIPEPIAILDSLGVAEAFAGKKVGSALLRQFCMNLEALGIDRVQTQVEWNQWDLLSFFDHHGFRPSPNLVLELRLGERNR